MCLFLIRTMARSPLAVNSVSLLDRRSTTSDHQSRLRNRPGVLVFLVALGVAALVGQPLLADHAPSVSPPVVVQIHLDNEAINPLTSRFVRRAVEQAEQEGASCLLIVLDTPGGLVDSTREMVKSILASKVPVVVYVAPSGARAASAGVFITLASHVAAMAPGTHIGAAHPVQVGGLPGSPPSQPGKEDGKPGTIMEEKILNDTVAWARTLAELRGRNSEWAARAVKESLSAPASEAVREGAVDLLADNVKQLLEKIDGREVQLADGAVHLRTAGAQIRPVEMWWGERLLEALASPNLAFLLLLFGFYGVLFELYTPGWGVAGTVGIICLVLGFFALAVLPISYVGLALVVVALALFVAEAFVTSYGFLTFGGVACLILGGLMLVDSPEGFEQISLWLLIPVALATAAITVFLVGSIVKASRARPQTGSEGLISSEGVALDAFAPTEEQYTGVVRTHGELWQAISSRPVSGGQGVRVRDRRGLTLLVEPVNGDTEEASKSASA